MFYIRLGGAAFGEERIRRMVRSFAESSSYKNVAAAAVFCRGRGVPVFFAEGGVYYPLAERGFCESIQKDFARIFMKITGGNPHPVLDLNRAAGTTSRAACAEGAPS